jgi:hypothetical protein
VQLKQVEYDVARTIAETDAEPVDPLAKQLLAEVYRNGRYVAVNGTGNGAHANGHAVVGSS